MIVKSGTDFKNLSEILLTRSKPDSTDKLPDILNDEDIIAGKHYIYPLRDGLCVRVIKHDITKDDLPDPDTEKHVKQCDEKLSKMMKRVYEYMT